MKKNKTFPLAASAAEKKGFFRVSPLKVEVRQPKMTNVMATPNNLDIMSIRIKEYLSKKLLLAGEMIKAEQHKNPAACRKVVKKR